MFAIRSNRALWLYGGALALAALSLPQASGQEKKNARRAAAERPVRDADLDYPPVLPSGKAVATDTSGRFLHPPASLRDDVTVAKTPPGVDFLFYPEQNYPGKPWSNWGDGSVSGGNYYSAIGDHFAIGRGAQTERTGTAFVYEYDPQTKSLRTLIDVARFLALPDGHYTPGKIHSRIDMGSDGWLYYATHRGSPRAAIAANHYEGDWILRTHPGRGVSEVVAHGPVPQHSIPNSVLDAERMIFYGGTAAGPEAPSQEIHFLAYDVRHRRRLYSGPGGPARSMILARSSGRVYFVAGNTDGELMCYDPSRPSAPPRGTGQTMGIRAATRETAEGKVYAVSSGQRRGDATLWQFDTKTETVRAIGTVAVGGEAYVASLDVGPAGRYLYYVPGAHGGGYRDGAPLVQYDVAAGSKKVIAFLHPFYQEQYGWTLKGTYSTAVSAEGDKVFITWNVSRGTRAWDCCALTVVHIPPSERQP